MRKFHPNLWSSKSLEFENNYPNLVFLTFFMYDFIIQIYNLKWTTSSRTQSKLFISVRYDLIINQHTSD